MHVGDLEEIRDLKAELRRQRDEIKALKAERDALEERCRDLLFEIKMVHS
jgi:cell division protein FtsB